MRDLDLLLEFVPLLDMLLAAEGGDALHLHYTGEPRLLPSHAVPNAAWDPNLNPKPNPNPNPDPKPKPYPTNQVSEAAWRPSIGRPDVHWLVAQAAAVAAANPRLPATLHVHCCGPTALASSVKKACAASRDQSKIMYHPENFEL